MPNLQRMGNPRAGILFGVNDPVCPYLDQNLAMNIGLRFGYDPRHADPLQDERAADALLEMLTLPDHGDRGMIDPERQKGLLICPVSLGSKRGDIGCLGNVLLANVDSGDVISMIMTDASNATSEATETDDGDSFGRGWLAIPAEHVKPFLIAASTRSAAPS